jgi:AcrR family transcriptional regulator
MATSGGAANSQLSVDDWVQEVAAAVRASDQRVVAAIRQAFLDDGFDPEQADMRANATFAAGIGFLHLSGSRPSPAAAGRREEFLEVMLRH